MRLSPIPFLLVLAFVGPLGLQGASAPDFNRDIRPILSDKCFRCHGPDDENRKGGEKGLRLDTAEGARTDLGGGGFAIVPGSLEKSELLTRITTTDDEDIMPPRKTGKSLSAAEVELLRQWIASGASYARHWAYEKPVRASVPVVKDAAWARGDVDRFILARLEKEGLRPQPEANRPTIARRVALDLTGLPPSLAEVEAFVADRRPDAYERFVDQQLAKPAYGEHWARAWLDLARYADSKGYADDQPRSIWAYRDYVINALNQDLPFDQFTVEQLAGDLLPNPTQAQLFATGFHRNTMNNTEGGTDDEEFRSVAVVDRVNTTMAVWMGTSMACAQCHTHKYDPLTQKEYFQLYAIFNQSEDADRNDESPFLEFFTEEQKQQKAAWEAEVAALEKTFAAVRSAHVAAAAKWTRAFPARLAWQPAKPVAAKSVGGAAVRVDADGAVFVEPGQKTDTTTVELAVTPGEAVTAFRIESLPHATLPGQGAGGAGGNFVVTRVRAGVKPSEPFRRARFVRIESPGKARMLSLAEVEVFSAGQNIAKAGVARQASTAENAAAARAIDGRTDGDFLNGSVSQTVVGDDPWWELDLGQTLPLERVVVWGRRGEEGTPAGLRVVVLDENRQPVFERVTREAPRPTNAIALSDPRDIKLLRATADYSQPNFDAGAVVSDAEPRRAGRGKQVAPKKGWAVNGAKQQAHTLAVQPETPLTLNAGETLVITIEQQSATAKATLNHFRIALTADARAGEQIRTPAAVLAVVQKPETERTPAEGDRLLDYYLREVAPELQTERKRLAGLQKSLDEQMPQTSPIMRELAADKQRVTHVQLRGSHLALGEEVTGGVPAAFPPLPAGAPVNRLTLARWLVDPENPLTARVQANRLWEAIFGIGLVRTTEEFGSQGEPPTHPELLDWLALDLVENKWGMKRFLRRLVTSAAYRQSSKVTPDALSVDPENRLVSRGPRFRLGAETVRDQALAVSGLLSGKTLGPSTRPFQPAFDLRAAFGGVLDWKTSEGEDRYRRGVYTEWRRSSPYPSMVTFDAPNREVCTLRRNRTNTPLQALVTLNDPVYVEAAQALARVIGHGSASVDDKLRDGFRRVLGRVPSRAEVQPLATMYRHALATYTRDTEQAAALIANPVNPPPATFVPAELAAWTTVANVLLNLDETLMKP
ncbi:PSD1 and planctomycete cytochrome C domain-containing protein [Horticoccus sp. 23ND18S-11]|uniref:PSD1 and planctomycete cytochrome C domain-containing protein n=1 Tax=Horticoccus sp. 23ND18S-11 TaxID=3391832 RepID=UPI0039C8C15F